MLVSNFPTRRLLTMVISLVVTIGLAACGAPGASVSPSNEATATPSTAPSPTPSQVDVAEAFSDKFAGSLTFFADLTGTLRAGEVEGELSGHLYAITDDVETLTVVTFPGLPPQETATIQADGVTYTRSPQGYWLESTGGGSAGTESPLSAALSNTDDLEVVGTEQIDGRTLHRLESRSPAQIDPRAFGVTDPTVRDFDATLAFLAEDDGTPAGFILTASWTQGAAGADVPAEFEMRFLATGDEAVIEAPPDPWRMHESAEFEYRMAYPSNWDVTHEPASDEFREADIFIGPVDGEVDVYRYGAEEIAGVTANEWFRGSPQVLTDTFGVAPELLATLSLDGLEIQVFGLNYTDQGDELFFQEAVVFGGDAAWDLDWYSLGGNEEADHALFLQFVNSLQRMGG